MATLRSVLAVTEQFIGFPTGRTKQVASRLQGADIIPTGGPRRPPELDCDHFLAILAASAMDTGLASAADSYRNLSDMTPGGLPPVPGTPLHLTETALERLQYLAKMAVGPSDEQRRLAETQIEFVFQPAAEIVFRERAGDTIVFHQPGHLRGSWDAGHRRSVTIRGGALASAVRALFP
jgi:hypothetical protein